jgi:hypothetical protein
MLIDRWKKASRRFLEIVATIILVLLSFGILLFVLQFFFPTATSIRDLFEGNYVSLQKNNQKNVVWDRSSIWGDAEEGEENLSAILFRPRNTVKARRSGAVAWTNAAEGMQLYHQDAVQTFNQSTALVSLNSKNFLEMKENTLVILKGYKKSLSSRKKRSLLLMVDGQLKGRLAGSDDEAVDVEVATPSSVTRVERDRSGKAPVDFAVAVNPDKSSSVAVYLGVAHVTAEGRTVTVKAHHGVIVRPGQAPPVPVPLPAAPAAQYPQEGSRYDYRDLPPRIRFVWDGPGGVNRYRFVLARDPGFQEVVEEEEVHATRFHHGNLEQGEYYWRVNSIAGRLEGPPSETRRIQVVQDLEAPSLRCRELPKVMKQERVTLAGETEAGTSLHVGGDPVPTDDTGKFTHEIRLRPGANVILVEAVDRAGNAAYYSQVVYRKDESGRE